MCFRKSHQAGMTLLEMILSISLLMVITVTAADMLGNNFEVRQGLSENNSATQRMSTAMQRLVWDLQHAYLLDRNDIRRPDGRIGGMRAATIFRIDPGVRDSHELRLTTKSHRPQIANAPEGDTVYVVYKLEESRLYPGRYNLLRGSTKLVPEDFREDPPMRVIARHVKMLNLQSWRGDDWVADRWDSTRGEWRDNIPHLVKVELEVWMDAPPDELADVMSGQLDDNATAVVRTIVHIPVASGFEQMRAVSGSVRWDRL